MDEEERKALEDAFIAGFRDAPDKRAFLDLAGIPLAIDVPGARGLRLLEVRLGDRYRVGAAAPGFGTRELSYQPLPGALVTRSTTLAFVYVSADSVREFSLEEARDAAAGEDRAPPERHAAVARDRPA